MASPMMLVIVLTVLWLIVVVPMILRREDDHATPRSGRRFAAAAPTAPEEPPMSPADRTDLSIGRQQMMARRRRSLAVLGVGSAVTVLLAYFLGGMTWLVSAPFVLGLSGYLLFLRNQAVRERDRRASRQLRSAGRPLRSAQHDATPAGRRFAEPPDSMVRIDDDDIALHALDTVDLTGLYDPRLAAAGQRRAG